MSGLRAPGKGQVTDGCGTPFSAVSIDCINNQSSAGVPSMTTQNLRLIQDSINQLEKLSNFLASQANSQVDSIGLQPIEKRIAKETLLTISVLLPKLHQVRAVHSAVDSVGNSCPNCDE